MESQLNLETQGMEIFSKLFDEIACTYQGLELTQNAIYLGGRDDNLTEKSYVFLLNF